jgi:ABC-2 type transport system ATP-binding protein
MELMNAIEIKSVSKKYRIYHDKSTTLKEHILFFKRTRYEEHHGHQMVFHSILKGNLPLDLSGQNWLGQKHFIEAPFGYNLSG